MCQTDTELSECYVMCILAKQVSPIFFDGRNAAPGLFATVCVQSRYS